MAHKTISTLLQWSLFLSFLLPINAYSAPDWYKNLDGYAKAENAVNWVDHKEKNSFTGKKALKATGSVLKKTGHMVEKTAEKVGKLVERVSKKPLNMVKRASGWQKNRTRAAFSIIGAVVVGVMLKSTWDKWSKRQDRRNRRDKNILGSVLSNLTILIDPQGNISELYKDQAIRSLKKEYFTKQTLLNKLLSGLTGNELISSNVNAVLQRELTKAFVVCDQRVPFWRNNEARNKLVIIYNQIIIDLPNLARDLGYRQLAAVSNTVPVLSVPGAGTTVNNTTVVLPS